MRTEAQFLAEYAVSHQNPTNQIVHMVCVPVIFIASIALLWQIPLGRFIPGISADLAPWINVATVGLIPTLIMYARMSPHALMVGGAWIIVSLLLTVSGMQAGLPVVWIAASAWVIAWAVQFWGHKVEGAKPSFADDLVFLLIGPLYVQEKFNRLVTTGSYRPRAD